MPGYVGDLDRRTHRHLTYPPHQGSPNQKIYRLNSWIWIEKRVATGEEPANTSI